jgi:hypothetical protein
MDFGGDDEQALLSAASLDAKAFGAFYRHFERPVLGFFMRATGRAQPTADQAAALALHS